MEVAGIFVALASEGLIVFPLSFLCERIQYNRQMGKRIRNHPHMRGVSRDSSTKFEKGIGLSPRVRGRWLVPVPIKLVLRFIPACAG